jgi:tetratricopeptide (TPR) repeat protein
MKLNIYNLKKLYSLLLYLLIVGNIVAQSDYEQAVVLYKQAQDLFNNGNAQESNNLLIKITEDYFELSSHSKAVIYNHLGLGYWEMGNFSLAILHYQMAQDFCNGTDDASRLLLSNIYNNIAIITSVSL